MGNHHVELGASDLASSRDIPARRRLFEGGSGTAHSNLSHKSITDLEADASNIREQAASFSSRAVLEGMSPHVDSFSEAEEEDVDDETDDMASIGFTRPIRKSISQTCMDEPVEEHSQNRETNDLISLPSSNNSHFHQHFEDLLSPVTSNSKTATPLELIQYIPSVLVGLLLNILDGLSYGMILFPLSHSAFSGTESVGLSLFYTSTIISQLVFSLGGSGFKSCIGSEMIEIVPFFHALSYSIANKLSNAPREEILATTLASFAFSCILTGLTFFLLGYLNLGALVGFFPMHVLLGCIGGVGWFLVATGIEVSARIEGGVDYNLTTLQHLFRDWYIVAQWGSCLALGCLLMYAERRLHHPLVVPSIIVITFILFHLVVLVVPYINLDMARDNGWVFPLQSAGKPWYWAYTLYRPSLIHVGPILECFPVMLAILFFSLIHVPINIPALAAAVKEDNINVNRELRAHGISNILAGLCGTVQNYLVYTNSVLFIKSGADKPAAGVMLSIATVAALFAGPVIIGYIPIIVVASIIFMMGFDLIAEALYDTYGSVRKQDYATIVIITLIMGCYDFVVGIVAGIMLACLSFVVTSARRSPIQSQLSGTYAHSTVIRHPLLQKYLKNVGKQTYIFRLTGALFFGTNGTIEKAIRQLCDCHLNDSSVAEIKFLIIDLQNVNDIDYCTVDLFLKLKRMMDTCRIRLVLAGAESAGHKIRGLRAVDLVPETVDFNDHLSVRVFATLNIALSWCENQFIKEYYQERTIYGRHQSINKRRRSSLAIPTSIPSSVNRDQLSKFGIEGSPNLHNSELNMLGTTPRSSYIKMEARSTAQEDIRNRNRWKRLKEPVGLLMQIVESISLKPVDFWVKFAPYFEEQQVLAKESLPRGFHLIESGIFHIQYESGFYEVALAGTAIGELSTMMKREADIRAENNAKIWSFNYSEFISVEGYEPFSELLQVYLGLISDRYNRMTEYYRISD